MNDSVQLVVGILKTALKPTGFFQEYYDSEPDKIPLFNLPALIVTKLNDESVPLDSADDDVTDTIVVKAVLNKRDDWAEGVDPEQLTERKLRKIMEERGADGRWLPATIKGAVRKPLDGNNRIAARMTTVYGVDNRPGDLLSSEAQLTIEVRYSVRVD